MGAATGGLLGPEQWLPEMKFPHPIAPQVARQVPRKSLQQFPQEAQFLGAEGAEVGGGPQGVEAHDPQRYRPRGARRQAAEGWWARTQARTRRVESSQPATSTTRPPTASSQ